MTREETIRAVHIMDKFLCGEKIQFKLKNSSIQGWADVGSPGWEWQTYDYRVKPKIQPFETMADFFVELFKRTDMTLGLRIFYLGNPEYITHINVDDEYIEICSRQGLSTRLRLNDLTSYSFEDCTPCGISEITDYGY